MEKFVERLLAGTYFDVVQDKELGWGKEYTSSPCRQCKHFGKEPMVCREYDDCLLGKLAQDIHCVRANANDEYFYTSAGTLQKKRYDRRYHKQCRACGTTFYKSTTVSKAIWKTRLFCCTDCYNKAKKEGWYKRGSANV